MTPIQNILINVLDRDSGKVPRLDVSHRPPVYVCFNWPVRNKLNAMPPCVCMFQLASAEQVECNAQDFALLSAYVLVLLFEIAACEVEKIPSCSIQE